MFVFLEERGEDLEYFSRFLKVPLINNKKGVRANALGTHRMFLQ